MPRETPKIEGFRPVDQIPYPRLYDQEAIAERLQKQLLEELGGIAVRPASSKKENRVTVGDIKTTPEKLTYEKFLEYFQTQLGLEKSTLTDKEKLAVLLTNVNSAMDKAREFISEYMGLTIDESVTHEHVKSLRDIYEIILKTSQYSRGKSLTVGDRLNRKASYCLLVLETISAFEIQKIEYTQLSVDAEKVKKMLVDRPGEGKPFFHHVGNLSDDFTRSVPNPEVASPIHLDENLSITYRDKKDFSTIAKLGRKPEAQFKYRESVLDEIGFEIKFPRIREGQKKVRASKEIVQTMAELIAHMIANNGARHVEIENANFLSRKEIKDVIALLADADIQLGKHYNFGKDTRDWLTAQEGGEGSRENLASSPSFENLKFTYKVDVPASGGGTRERNVEIQFADEASAEHNIDADHRLYKARQNIDYMTRRFGGCSEEWLTWRLGKALSEPGPRIDILVADLIEKYIEQGKIVRLPGISGKEIYADPTVFQRQIAAGLYDGAKIPKVVAHLEHAANLRRGESSREKKERRKK